ncbi:hypothetical protein O181_018532 [Austropuccinia psidii MF-1]|uniref:Uncharacterized protein n=1 Tax=Austropuccinia psidii MF-1 TaxID=1389203 RepID=A0A9Q3C9S2_9BASI|nr:hypothetical protein [Austropuccinia psidii MF-1]
MSVFSSQSASFTPTKDIKTSIHHQSSPNSIISSFSKTSFDVHEEDGDQSSSKTDSRGSIFSFNSKDSNSTCASSPNATLKSLDKIEKVLTELNQKSNPQEIKKKLHQSTEIRESFYSLFYHLTLPDQENGIVKMNDKNSNKTPSKSVTFETHASHQTNLNKTKTPMKWISNKANHNNLRNNRSAQFKLVPDCMER